MKSLWDNTLASQYRTDLEQRVYSSRLLGSDPSLVLHGGGNTSVKIRETSLVGEEEDILYVKGSGWDLETIEAEGFTPIRMQHLLKLAQLESLSDLQMVNEMKTHQTIAAAPTGSVEAILHAALPFRYVDHTHADAVVTVTNSPDAQERIREIYADEVIVVPYIMPGFDLARAVARQFAAEATAATRGMILMNHGIFSFGECARDSYEEMIRLVDRAEQYLQQQGAWNITGTAAQQAPEDTITVPGELRRDISRAAGRPMILTIDTSDRSRHFCQRPDLDVISQQGPATPDHVIRTKRTPMLGRDVEAYTRTYRAYFEEHAPHARSPVTMLDPAPRVILDAQHGLITAGKTIREAGINADISRHTMDIIQRADRLGGWRALPAADIFDVEYWELEQAKLRKGGVPPEFQGEIAVVTGAASGIGRACAESLLSRGAVVVGLDVDSSIATVFDCPEYLGLSCDITDPDAIRASMGRIVGHCGGTDMLILNAGIFPGGTRIEALDDDTWRRVMHVNLDANLTLLREFYPLLQRAPNYGRVVIIGSKNVPAPGPGAAAYSASKAALNQLARVAALEWGSAGIRINSLHPDAVFDTGLWTEEVLQARAAHYNMTVEQYKTKNLLKTEVRSRDVGELAAAMCGALFARTTAAQVPVDGGNDRVV